MTPQQITCHIQIPNIGIKQFHRRTCPLPSGSMKIEPSSNDLRG